MLTTEDNELLTRVGPGTPMGDLMRQYWTPALLSSELPASDSNPVRVKLLGEELIAFRDSEGRVGLVDNYCPHRGASMFYGRNEECGLRCVYHGWKFDVTGTCADMPNEPPESNFKTKVKIKAYPCHERGGVIWTYMGALATPPPLSDLEPNMLAESEQFVQPIFSECSWLQALEGDIDTSHLGFLHYGASQAEDIDPATFNHYVVKDRAPRYSIVDTDYGAMYGGYRPGPAGQTYWRIAQFLFPFYVMIPTGALGVQVMAHAWVPMDDEHTMYYLMTKQSDPLAVHSKTLEYRPNSTDWYGRHRLMAEAANDYLIDRDAQRRGDSFTGITGIRTQDKAVTESMGPIRDRTTEHLGSADVMVIRVRRRLMAAARDLAQRGVTPPGATNPDVFRVRSGGVFLPEGADWLSETDGLRQAFAQNSQLELAMARRGI